MYILKLSNQTPPNYGVFFTGSVEHYFVGLAFDHLIYLIRVLFRNIIDLLFAFFGVVFSDDFVFLLLFKLLICFSPYIANTDLCLLARLFCLINKLRPSFLT